MKLYQIDAFTNQPFSGNPAGVCIFDEPKPSKWMQQIAMELNLSETAFLMHEKEGYSLRWFTPVSEVDLCGHATLASAHVLWETGILKESELAVFFTKSGKLTANKVDKWIHMNFPSEPEEKCDVQEELIKALGVSPLYVGRNRLDYLVEIQSEDELKNLNPNWGIYEETGARGIIVTCQSTDPSYDFISRAFYPEVGVIEDPVTGSAHCCLAPYWGRKLNRKQLTGYQASKRGGVVKMDWQGDRVILSGQAVTVMEMNLLRV
ncbi:PhzF family phenazine biosynthesis protein [Metabacillus arenae]|uniref:PhzF family phenazine biosynthesis protein n=1 Tax=Metabacillus arenae TaxID=2771434 RepID=A0A926RXM5_9BACI|nr:PhzF family phenazine biosynthesis protein [Metabacillus arenae]MBD1380297.1 PhzF family phenazine biosynthesis protein [Metabacillus arenae]